MNIFTVHQLADTMIYHDDHPTLRKLKDEAKKKFELLNWPDYIKKNEFLYTCTEYDLLFRGQNNSFHPDIVSVNFNQLILQYPEYIDYLHESFQSHDKISALTNMLYNYSQVLIIPKNKVIEKPLELINALQGYSIEKLLIIVESGSSVIIKDSELNHQAISLRSLTLVARPSAQVTFYGNYNNRRTTSFNQMSFVLENDSKITYHSMLNSGIFTHTVVDIILKSRGAMMVCNNAYILHGDEQAIWLVKQKHYAPHSSSSVTVRGILADRAKFLYRGSIDIEKNADYSNATQMHKTLLFSNATSLSSEPALEIKTNNVICKHGHASGNFEFDHQFYLEARGISHKKSKQILARSFFNEATVAEFQSSLYKLNTIFD